MNLFKRSMTRVAIEACYQYSRLPFARGYGRFGKMVAATSRTGEAPFTVRRVGAKWELYLEPLRRFGDRGLLLYGKYYGKCEGETTEIIKRAIRPGSVCFDVGANMGFYSVLMARTARQIHSFEPASAHFRRLQRHVELNRLTNVRTHKIALSDYKGTGRIYVTPETASINPQHWKVDGDTPTDEFECMTLDEFCKSNDITRLDFIKVDIDGHEPAFLRGAIGALTRFKPTMVIEIVPECLPGGAEGAVELCETLIKIGYQLSDGRSAPHAIAKRFVEEHGTGVNALCTPCGY